MDSNVPSRSYSGYGRIGYCPFKILQSFIQLSLCFFRFDRRFRIYDISDFGETIWTYKRSEEDKVIDEMVLTGSEAPPYS